MQKQCDVKQLAMLGQNLMDQLIWKRRFIAAAALNLGEHADTAQEMLVHCVVVIHVELHHGDDLPEGRNETSEHACLVHPPQYSLRIVLGCQDFQKEPVGFLVLAQFCVDQFEGAGDRTHAIGVEGQIVLLRQVENTDQVDRIALESVRLSKEDAVLVDDEVVALGKFAPLHRPKTLHDTAEHGNALGVTVFQLRAKNRGQI